jgi:hypothetical protein
LQILERFIEGFDFVKMAPDTKVSARVVPESTSTRALSEPGRAYAIYAHGGNTVTLSLELPAGRYRAQWLNPRSGKVEGSQAIEARRDRVEFASQDFEDDVGLSIRRVPSP